MNGIKSFITGLICGLAFSMVFYATTDSSIMIKPWALLSRMDVKQEVNTSDQTTNTPMSIKCDPKPRLCYVDAVEGTTGNVIVSLEDDRGTSNLSLAKCAMTFREDGRMGNHMGQYATLLGLSRLNNRPALMTPGMSKMLRRYFKFTLPVMSEELYSSIKWTEIEIHDWMEESYGHMEGLFIKVTGFPNSYTFYDHLQAEIRHEFTLHDEIHLKAQNFLRQLIGNRTSVTLVGVHVRRGDYISYMKNEFKGVMAQTDFFVQATAYFRSRYADPIFVVVSNGMDWCKENIPNDLGDVHFVGNSNESDPINDFAILVNCNHTIFTIGTYGYWAGYLTGGEVIYLTNFTLPDSKWNKFFHYDQEFPPRWHPIAADLSPLYH